MAQGQPTWWASLTPEQREIQYNRDRKCNHEYKYTGPEYSNQNDDISLRAAWSYDPYFHTAHMEPCARWAIKPPGRWSIPCDCQMCSGMIGITREEQSRIRKV